MKRGCPKNCKAAIFTATRGQVRIAALSASASGLRHLRPGIPSIAAVPRSARATQSRGSHIKYRTLGWGRTQLQPGRTSGGSFHVQLGAALLEAPGICNRAPTLTSDLGALLYIVFHELFGIIDTVISDK